jgi:hypothetical protein
VLLSTAKGVSAVNDELSFEFLLCGQYERLLSECQHALDHWNARSESIRERHETGEETGRELLRLQARFAKAYTVLQRHVEDCERCHLAVRMSQNLSEADARALASVPN